MSEGFSRDDYASAFERVRALAAAGPAREILSLLATEADRLARFTVQAAGMHLDLAKQRIASADLDALLDWARAARLEAQRDAMLAGQPVNRTEGRAALHTALRAPAGSADPANAPGTAALVADALARMGALAAAVRGGHWRGAGGERITDLVHVGIGGSHLGPQLACEALRPFADPAIAVHFVSNVDPDAWNRLRARLRAGTTLAVIASKSWRTDETARNASALRAWLLGEGVAQRDLGKHMVAVTANVDAARAFGVADDAILPFWDWVGGRYSLWSAIGLPVMVAIGPDAFARMLAGAYAMDRHFAQAPLERNAPVLLALASAWNRLALPGSTEVVVPYCEALRYLPAHLQQLQMESNGKSVDLDGRALETDSVAVVWGSAGTDAQHSYFQALHQGTRAHPVDFVIAIPPSEDPLGRDRALVANAIAQGAALASGNAAADAPGPLRAHRAHPGNRPSTTILLGQLDPESFGALIALYEHKTAALGWLWRINSFDQWGVELGKVLAQRIVPELESKTEPKLGHDSSTNNLIRRYRRRKQSS